jgi:hypothetical protein
MCDINVLGFGGKAPVEVLNLLSKARLEYGIDEIIPNRSQSIKSALLQAPHRTFLKDAVVSDRKATSSLIIYCLPTTVTEYIGFSSEADLVRSNILSGGSDVVVVVYDIISNKFLGGSIDDILVAITGNVDVQSAFAGTSLMALSKLDAKAVEQAVGPTKRKDVVIIGGCLSQVTTSI